MIDLCQALDLPRGELSSHVPSAAENKTLEKTAAKITHPNMKAKAEGDKDHAADHDDEAGDDDFDFCDDPDRVLVHEGKVVKHSLHSLVPHSSKRYLFLCSDVLVVTKGGQGGGGVGGLMKGDKYSVKQVIWLDRAQIQSNYGNLDEGSDNDDKYTFRIFIRTREEERSYTFTCDCASDKKVWVQHLSAAMVQARAGRACTRVPGWQLDTVQGTLYSDALHGELEGVKRHLACRADALSEPDALGMSALHWAALRGHLDVASHLIREGADVHAMNNGINTPLLCAAAGGHDAVFRRLIAAGADITVCNLSDMDALFMVALFGQNSPNYSDILETLDEQGADFNRQDSGGKTVLHECTKRGLPIHNLVIKGADINGLSSDGLTPLQEVCCGIEVPDAEALRYLMDSGAHPNTLHPRTGQTPLQLLIDIAKKDPNGLRRASVERMDEDERAQVCTSIMHWTLHVLPAAMELCKKGARIEEDDLSSTRDSFQEAIMSAATVWGTTMAGDEFVQYVNAHGKTLMCPSSLWVPDGKHKNCQLCIADFNFQTRKHHCRACGALSCGACTEKKMLLSKGAKKTERVCDGCFNRLMSAAQQRGYAMRKTQRKTQETSRGALGLPEGGGGGGSKAEGAMAVANDTKKALIERGEKLAEINDKAEELSSGASDFSLMAKELARREKEKNIFGI